MTLTLKSYGFSLVVHGTIVAALYALDLSNTRRFVSSGQSQVVSIEMTPRIPAPPLNVDMAIAAETPLEKDDTASEAVAPPEPVESRELDRQVASVERSAVVDPIHRHAPSASPRTLLAPPSNVPELAVDRPPSMQRRRSDRRSPTVTVTQVPPPPRATKPLGAPPAQVNIPIEQFVGLEAESAADLSDNRPPEYPVEAVRRRLEGVVLLELHVAVSGTIDQVEVVESSGHAILDRAAVKAVVTWRGKPAKRWGRAIATIERLPIRFRL